MIEIGTRAPHFTLKDQNGNTRESSGFPGRRVLLSFHPLAWTPVCSDQMRYLEDNSHRFADLNVVPLGISVDSVPCKKAWASSLGITETILLSDFWPHGEMARSYGVFREKDGVSERSHIIIDENHELIFARVYPVSQFPDFGEILEFLEGL